MPEQISASLSSGLPDPVTFIKTPRLISAERFDEMLNILPPLDWTGNGSSQSFKMREFIYDNITTLFCKHGGRYFELVDDCHLSHRQIVDKCVASHVAVEFTAIDCLN